MNVASLEHLAVIVGNAPRTGIVTVDRAILHALLAQSPIVAAGGLRTARVNVGPRAIPEDLALSAKRTHFALQEGSSRVQRGPRLRLDP